MRPEQARTQHLLDRTDSVFVSLAPSYISEFSEFTKDQIIGGIEALGFSTVSETALGAQEVSAHVADMLGKPSPLPLNISTACPAVVLFIQKEFPHLDKFLTPLLSPLLAHAKGPVYRRPGV